jgi:Uma2 family endonuclease
VDEVLAFPEDGNRYELVDGELLVTPAPGPRHQAVVTHLVVWIVRHPDDERPAIVTDVLRWRVAPDADDLVVNLEELFEGLPK